MLMFSSIKFLTELHSSIRFPQLTRYNNVLHIFHQNQKSNIFAAGQTTSKQACSRRDPVQPGTRQTGRAHQGVEQAGLLLPRLPHPVLHPGQQQNRSGRTSETSTGKSETEKSSSYEIGGPAPQHFPSSGGTRRKGESDPSPNRSGRNSATPDSSRYQILSSFMFRQITQPSIYLNNFNFCRKNRIRKKNHDFERMVFWKTT